MQCCHSSGNSLLEKKKQFLHNKINQDGTVHFDRKKIEYTKKQ